MSETKVKRISPNFRGIAGVLIGARNLQDSNPEIANLYRQGYTYDQISTKLELEKRYPISPGNGYQYVRMAIRGFRGLASIPALEGLISKEELILLARQHRQRTGQRTFEERIGVHSQSKKQLSERSTKNYANGVGIGSWTDREYVVHGHNSLKRKNGIHALTAGQRRVNVALAVKARGQEQWSSAKEIGGEIMTEGDYFEKISRQPEFFYQKGHAKGKPNLILIRQMINNLFDHNRSMSAVRQRYATYVKEN